MKINLRPGELEYLRFPHTHAICYHYYGADVKRAGVPQPEKLIRGQLLHSNVVLRDFLHLIKMIVLESPMTDSPVDHCLEGDNLPVH